MPTSSTSQKPRQDRPNTLPTSEFAPAVAGLADWQVGLLRNLTHLEPLLVTDDDMMSRRFYHSLLVDTTGLNLIETGDPDEAERLCKAQPISLVMTCIIKPARMDGLKLVADLRADPQTCKIPILVITATQHTRELAFAAGADAYLSKPCHPNEILQEIWRLLRIRVL